MFGVVRNGPIEDRKWIGNRLGMASWIGSPVWVKMRQIGEGEYH